MNVASNREVHALVPAVWTAVPVDDGIIPFKAAAGKDEKDNDNSKVPQLKKKTLHRCKRDWMHMRILLTVHFSAILLITTMIFLVVSVNSLANPSSFMWWTHAVLGVFVVLLQVESLRAHGVRSLSPYHMSQKTLYILASAAGILMGMFLIVGNEPSQYTAIYCYLNSTFFVILSLMTPTRVISIDDGVPNALFSCASSNHGWVKAILWLHPFLVLTTFWLASLPNEGQIGLNKPFFWMAGWPILFTSHIWRKRVALRVYVRSDAAVIIDTTTERLVFDQVKLAYEALIDNDLHPEYFENIFDADSSRCVIVERQNGCKRFVVCPVEPEEFVAAVALAAQMAAAAASDDEEAGLLQAPADEYATVRCRRPLD